MNLAHMVFSHDPPELRADIAANRVSRDALIVPFVPLSRYKNVTLPHTGVPALDLVDDAGHANFNNQAYIGISNQDLKDVLRFVARHPNVYLRKVGGAYRLASTSAADYGAFRTNRPHIAALVGLQNRLLGQAHDLVPPAPGGAKPGWSEVAWLVVFQYAAVTVAGGVLALRALRRSIPPLTAGQWSFLFIAMTTVYATIIDNVVDFGDNNRFRFETDPLVCVATVALFAYVAKRRTRAVDPAGAATVSPAS